MYARFLLCYCYYMNTSNSLLFMSFLLCCWTIGRSKSLSSLVHLDTFGARNMHQESVIII